MRSCMTTLEASERICAADETQRLEGKFSLGLRGLLSGMKNRPTKGT